MKQSVLSMPTADRKELAEFISQSLSGSWEGCDSRADELLRAMCAAAGEPVILGTRIPRQVWYRAMIAAQLRSEGYTLMRIAVMLHITHASVLHLCRKVTDAVENPEFFSDIIPIWDKFHNEL